MGATSKQRTSSKTCEWEKNRRDKFNKAINTLGDLVKSANGDKDNKNTIFPKIEIVQRATAVLSQLLDEKSKLKAELLSLEVKLENFICNSKNKKDVSTQITITTRKKIKSSIFNEKSILNESTKKKDKTNLNQPQKNVPKNICDVTTKSLPTILPKAVTNNKKGNTFMVLPAAPYVIPQRPLYFPAAPQIFVLSSDLQPTNKYPINKTTSDITKTTMVNILPITHPLLASQIKTRKNYVKKKSKKSKKIIDKIVIIDKKTNSENNSISSNELPNSNEISDLVLSENNEVNKKGAEVLSVDKAVELTEKDKIILNNKECVTVNDLERTTEKTQTKQCNDPDPISNSLNETVEFAQSQENNEAKIIESTQDRNPDKKNKIDNILKTTCSESDKAKHNTSHIDKQNKINSILDTALCESDHGNTRLELAEELLAASPTAAFLMTFPVVSGNRVDSPVDDPNDNNNQTQNNEKSSSAEESHSFYPNNKHKELPKSAILTSNYCNDNQNKLSINEPNKKCELKTTEPSSVVSCDAPFISLPVPSITTTNCTLSDSLFPLDFDCNFSKPQPIQVTSYGSTHNLFYKSDNLNTMKNSIYSTCTMSAGNELNNFGLYPCSVDKFAPKSKLEYSNIEDNIMKLGSSRLTYDIDLGWSHKSFDFSNCPPSTTPVSKDNILTNASTPFSSSYNPFNPDFRVPLIGSSNKKDQLTKPTSFPNAVSSYYSQTSNLWSDEVPFYTNTGNSKSYISKNNIYFPLNNVQPVVTTTKHFDLKDNKTQTHMPLDKLPEIIQPPEKFTKKSPVKMPINWMTSETRTQSSTIKSYTRDYSRSYELYNQSSKKQEDGNYFPIGMPNYPSQISQDEFQVWPSTRGPGTTEIVIDPPPINLPTLVGDLALGPHEKRKHSESLNKFPQPSSDVSSCNNFLSVTQLMNSSTENTTNKYLLPNQSITNKLLSTKQNDVRYMNENTLKTENIRPVNNLVQSSYPMSNNKSLNCELQIPNNKNKQTKNTEKHKIQKNNYSAEALIRGGTCTQKQSAHKYNDFNHQQDNGVAQVSHYPIMEYSDNNYQSQQFSGTNLYNTTTNTLSNSFYSNLMPSSCSLISNNYTGSSITSDFIDYNQTNECNYNANQKYEEFKMKSNPPILHYDKNLTNVHKPKREMANKHKIECSKKDSKRYQSKRPKLQSEVEDWNENNLTWSKKTARRHPNLDELSLGHYNQQGQSQYHPDMFCNNIAPNIQNTSHMMDNRSIGNYPATSRANFNLSTLFPEITMKVPT